MRATCQIFPSHYSRFDHRIIIGDYYRSLILVLTADISQLITVSTTASVYNHPQFYKLPPPHSLTNSTMNFLTSHITPNNIPPQIAQCHCSNNLTYPQSTQTLSERSFKYLKFSQIIQSFCGLLIFFLFMYIFFCNCTLM